MFYLDEASTREVAALLLVVLGLRTIWLAHRSERSLVGAMQ